jgi:choice-of-anchor B domain-containing protein
VEVTSDGSLTYLGRLPTQTVSSLWRDLKVIGDFVYIGSEARSHGIQVFDLNKLLDVDPASPVVFSVSDDLTAHFDGVGNSHNVVANADTDRIYAVGASVCSGGLVIVDVSEPSSPVQIGCASEDGYVHDAQCVVYDGVDTQFVGREICYGYNEDSFTIYDVTDASNPTIVSRTPYQGSQYSHQGWVVDAESRYVLLDDELDEMYNGEENGRTKTHIFDISSLENPVYTGSHFAVTPSIDHNQYVVDGLSYQANYASGLRILDVSGLADDPTGATMSELGFFDCYPEDDANPEVEFYGAWSVYPYFQSGVVIMNCIERGLFALRFTP